MAGASDTVDTGRGHERVRGYRRTENDATEGCGTAIIFKTVHVSHDVVARGYRRTANACPWVSANGI